MKQRIITAIFILAVTLPILIFSEYIVYPIALSLLALAAVFETFRVIGTERYLPLAIPSYLFALAAPVGCYALVTYAEASHASALLYLVAALFFMILWFFGVAVFCRGKFSFSVFTECAVMFLYVVASFSALTLVRYTEKGAFCFALIFIAAWITDVFAYFTGVLFGKHKLIPAISPKKTVEGAVGGIVFGTAAFVLYGFFIGLFTETEPNYLVLALAGLLLSVVSQIGDLVASLLKREHGVKDYGKLLPGHGGIMDRFDSILAVSMPLIVVCLIFPPFA